MSERSPDDSGEELMRLAKQSRDGLDLVRICKNRQQSWAEDTNARFRLWCQVSGVDLVGRKSLAHRLHRHRVASLVVHNLLRYLEANIQVLCWILNLISSDSQQDEAVDLYASNNIEAKALETCTRIDADLGQLIAYTRLIIEELRTQRESKKEFLNYQALLDDDELSSFISLTKLVLRRMLGPEGENVIRQERPHFRDRLERTIVRRWERISYRMSRTNQKDKAGIVRSQMQQNTHASKGDSVFSKSHLGTTQFSGNEVDILEQEGPVSIGSTLRSTAILVRKLNQSSPRTASVGRTRALVFPTAPDLTPIGQHLFEFYCEYCGLLVQASGRDGIKTWQKHLMEDLQPFICTSEHCSVIDVMYASFEEWKQHMSIYHEELEWYCDYCEKSQSREAIFSSEETLLQHVLSKHHKKKLKSQNSRRVALQSECDLCGNQLSGNKARNMTPIEVHKWSLGCVAQHLKEYALVSLPWHLQNSFIFGTNKSEQSSSAMESTAMSDDSEREQMSSPDKKERMFDAIRETFGTANDAALKTTQWLRNLSVKEDSLTEERQPSADLVHTEPAKDDISAHRDVHWQEEQKPLVSQTIKDFLETQLQNRSKQIVVEDILEVLNNTTSFENMCTTLEGYGLWVPRNALVQRLRAALSPTSMVSATTYKKDEEELQEEAFDQSNEPERSAIIQPDTIIKIDKVAVEEDGMTILISCYDKLNTWGIYRGQMAAVLLFEVYISGTPEKNPLSLIIELTLRGTTPVERTLSTDSQDFVTFLEQPVPSLLDGKDIEQDFVLMSELDNSSGGDVFDVARLQYNRRTKHTFNYSQRLWLGVVLHHNGSRFCIHLQVKGRLDQSKLKRSNIVSLLNDDPELRSDPKLRFGPELRFEPHSAWRSKEDISGAVESMEDRVAKMTKSSLNRISEDNEPQSSQVGPSSGAVDLTLERGDYEMPNMGSEALATGPSPFDSSFNEMLAYYERVRQDAMRENMQMQTEHPEWYTTESIAGWLEMRKRDATS